MCLLVLAVLLPSLAVEVIGFNLTIVHTNDVHSRFEEMNKYSGSCSGDECYGGFARLKTKMDEVRLEHPHTLVLDAGDQFQGTLWFYHYGGWVVAHFMNLLGYDAMVCIQYILAL
jgi:2',3'-cyclic-nucleotide 2'-phosphodiesterase (5'-nucleotidase family)